MARYGRSSGRFGEFERWAPYVSVAERKKQAQIKKSSLEKKGKTLNPVIVTGRTIATTFWGKAWCKNLEAYSDFSNRLPRGRSYVRNGAVIDLQIAKGEITALVCGASVYNVKIKILELDSLIWKKVVERCAGQIDSLVELLKGRFSQGVMEIVTSSERGLFPTPKQITLSCSCPDAAVMCKHVAAVLYGVGARLDQQPELFFLLRNVDHADLVRAATTTAVASGTVQPRNRLESTDLSGLFGIEVEESGKAKSDHDVVKSEPKETNAVLVAKKAPKGKKNVKLKKRSERRV